MSPKITKILLTWPTNKNVSFVLFPTVITIPQVLLIFTWCYLKGYSTYISLVLPQGLLIFTRCYLKGYLYLPGATSRATYLNLVLPQRTTYLVLLQSTYIYLLISQNNSCETIVSLYELIWLYYRIHLWMLSSLYHCVKIKFSMYF